MPNGSFMTYKRRRTRKKKGSRVERTKCCRTDFGASLSVSCSIAFLCRVRGGSRCFEERPSASGSTSNLLPFCASQRTGIGICSPACSLVSNLCPIAGCSVSIRHSLSYIYIHCLRLLVSASVCVLCVEGPCPCAILGPA